MNRPILIATILAVLVGMGLCLSASASSDCPADSDKTLTPVPIARVAYVPADYYPEYNSFIFSHQYNPTDVTPFDYGNRSLVIDLGRPWWASRIVVTSTEQRDIAPKLDEKTFRVYTSNDNITYTLHSKSFTYKLTKSDKPSEVWRLELAGLKIVARYIKLKQTYDNIEYGFGIANLKNNVNVYTDNAFTEKIFLTGLCVDPAQSPGKITAYVNMDGSETKGVTLEVSAENAETWKLVSRKMTAKPGDWIPIVLESPKLKEGSYWIKARLVYDNVVLSEKEACIRINAQVVNDFGKALPTLKPGGTLVLQNLPKWVQGGDAVTYNLPYQPGKTYCGINIPKGNKAIINLPLEGEYAVYFAAESPWPGMKSKWGSSQRNIRQTQSDWQNVGGVQEHFAGYGSFKDGPLTIEGDDAPINISYLRIVRLTPAETELIQHKTDPTYNRRVIYNNDGHSEIWDVKESNKAKLLELVDRYQGTDTEIFEMGTIVSGWVNYPSKYATFWRVGELPDNQWVRGHDIAAVALFNQLENDSLPIFPTLAKRGKELGISVFGSLRMSSYSDLEEQQTIQPYNGRLWHEHPEMRIKLRDGSYAVEMSFAWEAVRNQRLGVLRELLEMGCEGICMDFCRYPIILGYDEPLVEGFKKKYGVSPLDLHERDERWISYRCEVMNDFIRAVRKQTYEISAEQERKLRISVRIPATAYHYYGYDPQTWTKEGLIDILIPHYPGPERDFDIRPWVAMVKDTNVKLYPGIEVIKETIGRFELTDAEIARGIRPGVSTKMSSDDYQRKAWKRYRQGADGMYFFNSWLMGEEKNLLGDKRSLKRWSYFEDPMNLPRQQLEVNR